MALNPDTGRFEKLTEAQWRQSETRRITELGDNVLDPLDEVERIWASPNGLVRPDSSAVPDDWTVFSMGELIVIKKASFRIAYIGDSAILLEPCRASAWCSV